MAKWERGTAKPGQKNRNSLSELLGCKYEERTLLTNEMMAPSRDELYHGGFDDYKIEPAEARKGL